jgi:hypothetical protein
MTTDKDLRIKELEAEIEQMRAILDIAKERDQLRELCKEMRADLIAEVREKYDYKWGDTKEWQDEIDNDIAQLESIKKADAILGDEFMGFKIKVDPGMDDQTVRLETEDGQIVSIENIKPSNKDGV